MTKDDIIRMAREAGFEASVGKTDKDDKYHPDVNAIGRDVPVEWLERFAALVSKQERGLGFNQGYKQAIKDCVVLLMIQHEMANGAHNYWHVAANLIQAEYGVQHDD